MNRVMDILENVLGFTRVAAVVAVVLTMVYVLAKWPA